MTKLILVRHGETDWNQVNRIQGWLDIPLNTQGIKQAERLADELSRVEINAIYSSPLSRSLQTATIVAGKHALEVLESADLREINQGEWQGLLVSEAREKYKDLYTRWLNEPFSVRPPHGETLEEVSRRVETACLNIVDSHPGETVCLVTHKVTAALIKCHYQNLDYNRLWTLLPDNATWEVLNV